MVRQHSEPYLWLLFSAGGMLSAMLMPVLVLLFGIAFPLGWIQAPTYEHMLAVVGNPLIRLVLLGLCVLSLFHAAHRFRTPCTMPSDSGTRCSQACPTAPRSWVRRSRRTCSGRFRSFSGPRRRLIFSLA